jgi:hypothetical protein
MVFAFMESVNMWQFLNYVVHLCIKGCCRRGIHQVERITLIFFSVSIIVLVAVFY